MDSIKNGEEKKVDKNACARFSKSQLIKSERYRHQRDLIQALADDKKTYTHDEIANLVGNFMKGKVE
jgi:hypothetical protein